MNEATGRAAGTVLALVPPSTTPTEVPLLTEHELLELLDERVDDSETDSHKGRERSWTQNF